MGTHSRSNTGLITPKERRAREQTITAHRKGGGDIRVHVAYPNNYWVAMSNLGFQAVVHLFQSESGVDVDRAFLPDGSEPVRSHESRWKTFEDGREIRECDVLGFSLSFETDYPHLVRMLDNQGILAIGHEARERLIAESAAHIPITIAGGTGVTLNPEPVADLVDVIALGEAEEMIPEIVRALRELKARGANREEVLLQLAHIEGLYIPRFHTPHYHENGTISGISVDPRVPGRPRRRFVKDISKFPTYSRIVTPDTEFKSMFLTETGRGCEMGCRFCVAGYIYRPVRKRSEESIAETVQIGMKATPAVGFVGASVSSHKAISTLAKSVADAGGRASLSSIMSQKVTKELAASITESEYKTVALAPEAGSERLRRAAGKRVSNAQVLEAASMLAESGIKGFKLYYIVGLPTERDEDVDAIAELSIAIRNRVLEISKSSGVAAWVQLSVNPFIPKASTPFQWEPMLDLKMLDQKIERVHSLIKRTPNLEMRFEPPKESYFQALLSRGDRRVAKLLVHAEKEGKDWKWALQQARKQLFSEIPPLEFYSSRRIPYDEILPWEVVDSRIDRALLERECRRAYEEEEGAQGGEADTVARVSGHGCPSLASPAVL